MVFFNVCFLIIVLEHTKEDTVH